MIFDNDDDLVGIKNKIVYSQKNILSNGTTSRVE